MPRHILSSIVGVLALACAPAGESGPADTQADEAAIRAVVAEEVRAANAGDVEAFLAAFSDDAVAMPPEAPAASGPAFRELITEMFAEVDVAVEYFGDDALIIDGDHAIHQYSFNWTLTPKAGGDAMSEQGKGIHVLARQSDGSWKITHDQWSPDAPNGM